MRNAAWRVGTLCIALSGVLAWQASSYARVAAKAGQEQAASHARVAAAAGAQEKAQAVEVKIDNFSFMPQEITVAVGTKVTWVNRDDIPHTVVSTNGTFKSKALDTDDQYSSTFEKAGTYDYFCSIHPKMTAKVVVK
jgi:amicyanin